MGIYDFLVTAFNRFIVLFPAPIRWIATLLILFGLIGAFIGLIRKNIIFVLLAILLLPFLIPVLASVIGGIYHCFLYLAGLLKF